MFTDINVNEFESCLGEGNDDKAIEKGVTVGKKNIASNPFDPPQWKDIKFYNGFVWIPVMGGDGYSNSGTPKDVMKKKYTSIVKIDKNSLKKVM